MRVGDREAARATRRSCSSATACEAPEYGWDDYKGVDSKGKTLVMLVGDPPVPDPADPHELDPKVFGGRAMTYYGRWTYKYEIGAEEGRGGGASSSTRPGRPAIPARWCRARAREKFDLVAPDRNMGRAAVEGWITLEQAKELFALAGQDFDALKSRPRRRVPAGAASA